MIGRQGGEGHVNGQTAEAMVEKMGQRGWRKDRDVNNISRMFNQLFSFLTVSSYLYLEICT